MSRAKPHTIALRLSDDEYQGLRYYMMVNGTTSMTEVLRDLLPLDQLAAKASKAERRD